MPPLQRIGAHVAQLADGLQELVRRWWLDGVNGDVGEEEGARGYRMARAGGQCAEGWRGAARVRIRVQYGDDNVGKLCERGRVRRREAEYGKVLLVEGHRREGATTHATSRSGGGGRWIPGQCIELPAPRHAVLSRARAVSLYKVGGGEVGLRPLRLAALDGG